MIRQSLFDICHCKQKLQEIYCGLLKTTEIGQSMEKTSFSLDWLKNESVK